MTHPTDDELEGMARDHDTVAAGPDKYVMGHPHHTKTAAMLRACKGGEVTPRAYLYRYADPFSGKPVWRSDCGLWNGQRPVETLPLYTRPAPDARQEGWNEAIEAAAQAVPQGWCQPETSHIEMDVVLGKGIQAAIRALAEKGPDHE